MKVGMFRSNFLNTASSMSLYMAVLGAAAGSMAGGADSAGQSMAETDLAGTRYEGTTAIFYHSSQQAITREWDNISKPPVINCVHVINNHVNACSTKPAKMLGECIPGSIIVVPK